MEMGFNKLSSLRNRSTPEHLPANTVSMSLKSCSGQLYMSLALVPGRLRLTTLFSWPGLVEVGDNV